MVRLEGMLFTVSVATPLERDALVTLMPLLAITAGRTFGPVFAYVIVPIVVPPGPPAVLAERIGARVALNEESGPKVMFARLPAETPGLPEVVIVAMFAIRDTAVIVALPPLTFGPACGVPASGSR